MTPRGKDPRASETAGAGRLGWDSSAAAAVSGDPPSSVSAVRRNFSPRNKPAASTSQRTIQKVSWIHVP